MKKLFLLSLAVLAFAVCTPKHATAQYACAGPQCFTHPTVPSTCINGGTMPSPNGTTSSDGVGNGTGVKAELLLAGVPGCNIVITYMDASLSGAGQTSNALGTFEVSETLNANGCVSPGPATWSHNLGIGPDIPSDSYVTGFGGMSTTVTAGDGFCVYFANGVTNAYERINVVWQYE